MSNTSIHIQDLQFEPYISQAEIEVMVRDMASNIRRDYAARNPIFLVVLNGAFFFAADLIKAADILCEIHFVKLSSYSGTSSTGEVRQTLDATVDIRGRDIVVIEDIIDTGLTMSHYLPQLTADGAKSVALASLLVKPSCLKHEVDITYRGRDIDNSFVVGYGLDYNEKGRHLHHIYHQVG